MHIPMRLFIIMFVWSFFAVGFIASYLYDRFKDS